jgi:hypothetical protein
MTNKALIQKEAIDQIYKEFEKVERFLPLGLKWFWNAPKWLQRWFISKKVPDWVVEEALEMRSEKIQDGSLSGKVESFSFGHPATLVANEGDFMYFSSKYNNQCVALLFDKNHKQSVRAWVIALWDKNHSSAKVLAV